jgi:gliding motility-associated protein GldM
MKGEIYVFDPEKNAEVPYPFETRYTVGAPMATVSPTKMNVFYIGVDNPVDITVSGVSAANVIPSVTGGSISGSAGHYIVKPNGAPGSKAMVNVSAKMPDGTTKAMGKMEFRVKRVPDPVAKYIGSKGGPMTLGQAKVGAGINCELENFDFDLKFVITSFSMGANIGGEYKGADCTGPGFNSNAKDILARLKTGSKVFFDNIKAKGPDGTSRTLAPFFITCK